VVKFKKSNGDSFLVNSNSSMHYEVVPKFSHGVLSFLLFYDLFSVLPLYECPQLGEAGGRIPG
jgi:hypothetical protein